MESEKVKGGEERRKRSLLGAFCSGCYKKGSVQAGERALPTRKYKKKKIDPTRKSGSWIYSRRKEFERRGACPCSRAGKTMLEGKGNGFSKNLSWILQEDEYSPQRIAEAIIRPAAAQ